MDVISDSLGVFSLMERAIQTPWGVCINAVQEKMKMDYPAMKNIPRSKFMYHLTWNLWLSQLNSAY